MRVISGKYKGRKLLNPTNSKIRPTKDSLKETLFNVLYHKFKDYYFNKNVLDIFCGSGAIGIEFLSRGANFASFVDNDLHSLKLTKNNLKCIPTNTYEILLTDFLKSSNKEYNKKYNIAFLDPPYTQNIYLKAINKLLELNILENNSLIILESSNTYKLNDILNLNIKLKLLIEKTVGKSKFTIFQLL